MTTILQNLAFIRLGFLNIFRISPIFQISPHVKRNEKSKLNEKKFEEPMINKLVHLNQF